MILWDAIPVTYMLFVHHRTFKSMIRQMNHDSVDSRDERVPEKIGYLRVASVNVDSGHTATEPSEQNADSKLTGNFVKVQSRVAAPSLQSTLSINSYERYTMV